MASIVGANIREVDVFEIPKPWTKFYDNGVQETIEIPEIPVHKMYENTAKKYPNKIAFDFFGLKWTFEQIINASNKVASFLKEMGVEKGDRIIVSLPNTPHYFIIANAVFKMGATLVQSNPIYTERELRHIAKNSEAKMMFAMDLSYNNYRALIEEGIFERVVIARIEDFLRFPLNILFKAFVKKKKYGEIKIEKNQRDRRLGKDNEISKD